MISQNITITKHEKDNSSIKMTILSECAQSAFEIDLNHEQVLDWLSDALLYLGSKYLEENEIEKNYASAIHLLRQSAELGNSEAQFYRILFSIDDHNNIL